MTEEFKKARDVEAMDNFMYCHSPISDEAKAVYEDNCRKFRKGADWAYEWLANNAEHKQSELAEKLAIAVEALEWYRKLPMSEQDQLWTQELADECIDTAKQALSKIKGDEK